MGEIHAKKTPKSSRPIPRQKHPPSIQNVDHYNVHENVDMWKVNQGNLNVLTYPKDVRRRFKIFLGNDAKML
jgi:hypothetical protein